MNLFTGSPTDQVSLVTLSHLLNIRTFRTNWLTDPTSVPKSRCILRGHREAYKYVLASRAKSLVRRLENTNDDI